MLPQGYMDRVTVLTERAQELFPNEVLYNKKQIAQITGQAVGTLYNDKKRKFRAWRNRKITIREYVRMEMQ